MLRRQHEEGRAEQRVRARGEHRQLLAGAVDAEDDARAVRAPDPVALHRQDALGPLLEQLHLVEQRVGVVGDPEEPLRQALRLDLGAAALAVPVDHLLVGEHRLVLRAPLDRRLLAVREPLLEEAQEEPLRPAVVGRVGRGELARPVDRPAHPAHLLADRGDVAVGHLPRMAPLLDRGVLGGQAERVVAHRAQHLEAPATPQVHEHVSDRVVERVPHVQLARGVGEHLDDVGLARVPHRAGLGVGHDEGLLVLPDALPLRLDRGGVVRDCVVSLHRSLSSPGNKKASRSRGSGGVGTASPRRSLGHARSCCMPSDGNRQNRRMLDLFPDSARVADGELALGGVAASAAGGALRDAARRLLRGDAACAGARVARGDRCRPARLRDEGVPQRRGASPAPRGRSRRRRRLGGRARVCARRRAHGRRARRPRQQQEPCVPRAAAQAGAPVVLDAPGRGGAGRGAGVERVLVRVTLGVDADTHEAIRTGHHGSKFGLPPDQAVALLADALEPRARRARAPRARRLAARGLRRAGRDDRPARVVRRPLQARARLDGAGRRPRRRLRHPPPPRRAGDRRGRARGLRRRDRAHWHSPRRACPSPRSGSSRAARSSDAPA